MLRFTFHESDTALRRFVCRLAAKKNNEHHSDSLFPKGKQMGSHFLKLATVAEAFFFFFPTRDCSSSI
jgi:hypothetical protein